jgi:PIN domain nuclease of toxin-antitoxin system
VVLLDAYALLALLADEAPAGEVVRLIAEHESGITAVNLAEVVDVMQRRYSYPLEGAESAVDAVCAGGVSVVPVGDVEGRRAGALRAEYYGRRARSLSLADCFLLAATGDGDAVATSDPTVAEVARLEQIDAVLLPDSAGRRP